MNCKFASKKLNRASEPSSSPDSYLAGYFHFSSSQDLHSFSNFKWELIHTQNFHLPIFEVALPQSSMLHWDNLGPSSNIGEVLIPINAWSGTLLQILINPLSISDFFDTNWTFVRQEPEGLKILLPGMVGIKKSVFIVLI